MTEQPSPLDQPLWSVFSAVARSVPDKDAIVWRDLRISYRQLLDRAQRLAGHLASLGLGCHTERAELDPWQSGQDLVGLYLLNGPEYLEASLAGYRSRVAPFNINYRYGPTELEYLLRDARPGALIFHGRYADQLAKVLPTLDETPHLIQVADGSGAPLLPGAVDYEEAVLAASPLQPGTSPPDRDDLYVVYTGGTTGMPKCTLWAQGDIYLGALGGSEWRGADLTSIARHAVSETERVLVNAPLMHGAAHWTALRTLLRGGTVVINRVVDKLDPHEVWSTIEAERCTRTLMVGEAFVRPLLDALEAGTYDTSSLEAVVLGGASTSPESKARIHAGLPQAKVIDTVGASELGGALTAVTTAAQQPARSSFRAGSTVQILSADRSRVLSTDEREVGWLAKSGRIPLGYLGDRDKTEQTFPTVEGLRWSTPGDRARYNADGSVELLGRDSATITSGGEKIFAEEVESAMLAHSGVRDAVVVGVPSERWGQAVVAILTAASDVEDRDILDTAGQRIARYKLPKQIIRVPEVVRSPSGKADYRWAQQLASALAARQV